jgi:hypothetical protein
MPFHVTKKGECISSIAFNHGFFIDTIWNHEKNEELRQKRENPYILLEGDLVFIPEKVKKVEIVSIDKRNHFRLKKVPEILHIQLLDEDDKPITNESYEIEIVGKVYKGTTDQYGVIIQYIMPNVSEVNVMIGKTGEKFRFLTGNLDPWDTITGMQARLNNLGFACGPVDGDKGIITESIFYEYCDRNNNLDDSDIDKDKMINSIRKQHGI